MSKHVLIVSYTFPPIGGAGVQRIIKYVKYLGYFDWKPSVLTVVNPSVPVTDNSFLADIPQTVNVYRTKTLEPGYQYKAGAKMQRGKKQSKVSLYIIFKSFMKNIARLVLLPDPQVLWWPSTSIFLYKYLKNNKVDVLFSSGPPFSTLILTVLLGKIYKIPVVSDFRDDWSFTRSNFENHPKYRIIKSLDKLLERFVINNSAFITVASPGYEQDIRKKYHVENCIAITNGYDEDDFDENNKLDVDLEKDKINIVYSGTVWGATSLEPFITALENVLEAQPGLRDKISFSVIGRVVPEEEHYFKSLQKTGIVRMIGYINHDLLIQYIMAADVLVLSLAEKEGSGNIIPGKIFEYMMCNAPVISTVPDGVCSEIISKIKGFYVASPSDIQKIEDYILLSFQQVQTSTPPKKEGISSYSRINITKQLSTVLDSTIKRD